MLSTRALVTHGHIRAWSIFSKNLYYCWRALCEGVAKITAQAHTLVAFVNLMMVIRKLTALATKLRPEQDAKLGTWHQELESRGNFCAFDENPS